MKKKILGLLLGFILSFSVFAGCSLVEQDKKSYYTQVIAKIEIDGHAETITREDVLLWFNSRGYMYVQYYGQTVEEALKTTINEIIDYRLRVYEARKTIVSLSDKQKNEVVYNIHETMLKDIADLEKALKDEWKITEEESDTTSSSNYKNEPIVYSPKIKLEGDKLVRVNEADAVDFSVKPVWNYLIIDQFTQEVWNRYLRSIQQTAETKGDKISEKEAFDWEYDRLYEIHEDSMFLEVYQENYLATLDVNTDLVLETFKIDYLASYSKYNTNYTGDNADEDKAAAITAYRKAVQSSRSSLYYHPTEADGKTEFMNVLHILFKYTDEMRDELLQLENKLASGLIEQPDYDTQYALLTNPEVVQFEFTENGVTEKRTAAEVYTEIKNAIDATENNLVARARVFRDLMFKYSDDTGLVLSDSANLNWGYVVNLKDHDQATMVEEFIEESQQLYTQNANGGNMSVAPVFHKGDLSASNQYSGFHIVFNLGGVTNNGIDYEQVNSDNVTWQDLWEIETFPGSGVNLFQLIYDSVQDDDTQTTTKVSMVVDSLKANSKITKWVYRLKDIYKE